MVVCNMQWNERLLQLWKTMYRIYKIPAIVAIILFLKTLMLHLYDQVLFCDITSIVPFFHSQATVIMRLPFYFSLMERRPIGERSGKSSSMHWGLQKQLKGILLQEARHQIYHHLPQWTHLITFNAPIVTEDSTKVLQIDTFQNVKI